MKQQRTFKRLSLSVFVALNISLPALAQTPAIIGPGVNHPERKWQYLETSHFKVHFYQGYENFARYAVNIAEQGVEALCKDLGVTLTEKIPLFITEDEFWNGYAEPLRTRIVLDPRFSLEPTIGLPRFMLHELTHILNFLAVDNGLPMGRLMKAAGLPAWFAEGLAQYEAEYLAPEMDRLLRLHSLNNTLMTPAERNAFILLGNRGADGYNEGYGLVSYMFDTYGHDKLAELLDQYRTQQLPFDEAIALTFGKSLLQLEAEWREQISQRYQQQTQHRQKSLSEAQVLMPYSSGKTWYAPQVSPDGKWIAYQATKGYPTIRGYLYPILPLFVADRQQFETFGQQQKQKADKQKKATDTTTPTVENPQEDPVPQSTPVPIPQNSPSPPESQPVANPQNAPVTEKELKLEDFENKLVDRVVDARWRPDSQAIAYTTLKAGPNGTAVNRVFIQAVKADHQKLVADGSPQELDAQHTTHSPSWSADGSKLYVVRERALKDEIVMYDLKSGQSQILLAANDLRQFRALQLSPDQQQLMFEVFLPGEGQHLMLLNTQTQMLKQLTNPGPHEADRQALWAPDSQSIYFVSTRQGFADLYRLNLASQQLETLSQTYSGIETPSLSANGQSLYFALHEAEGTQLEKIELNRLKTHDSFKETAGEAIFEQAVDLTPIPRLDLKAQDYLPWMGLEVVVPVIGRDEEGDQIGFLAQFSDLLQQHAFNVLLLHGIASQRIGFSTAYINRFFDTSFGIEIGDSPLLSFTTDGSQFFIQRDQHISLFANRPLFNEGTDDTSATRIERFATLEFTAAYQTNLTTELNGTLTSQQMREGFNNTLALTFNDNRSRGKSDGFRYSVGVSGASRLWGSQYEFLAGTLDWRQYIPIWAGHTLAYQLSGTAMTGETRPALLGGPPLSNLLVLNFQNIMPLRGFRLAEFQGPLQFAGSLEYRLPLLNPIVFQWENHYLENLHAAAFVDIGDAWYPEKRAAFPHIGAGLELRSDVILNRRNSFQLYLGAGKAIAGYDEDQNYLNVWYTRPLEIYGGFANVF